MWGESSKNCETNCQCSGLITESFRINSGNGTAKRKQEEASAANYKLKMNPHSLDFNQSPLHSPKATPSKRRILGEIHNSLRKQSPVIERLKGSPLRIRSPLIERNSLSPLTSRQENFSKRSTTKISRIFEERTKFKMSNKENEFISETFMKFDLEEEARDSFGKNFTSHRQTITNWSMTKLDFTDAIPSKSQTEILLQKPKDTDSFVPEKHMETEDLDLETLHDLEDEFDADNFDSCTKYEIISTDSPNIISRGRTSSSRKVSSRNFQFGASLTENEQSTSFNRPNATATRMLNFEDENFEFTSPPIKKLSTTNVSVKKSLKFNETPTKNILRHERSDSSIGSMNSFSSPASSRLRLFNSESTTSMESGFISELEEPFLEMEESNSPKIANLNELLSGQIKENALKKDFGVKRPLHRSLSFNPEASRARVSLFSISESPGLDKKSQKRAEPLDTENVVNKRRKSNCHSPELERVQRPVLQRAFSENNASIMSALARSVVDPDLIGDFSQPFALPLTNGDHSDLKSISCDTLAALIRGEFDESIHEFKVIDCRYPYEFEGGHIIGAVNLFTPGQVLDLINKPLQPKEGDKRSILVFHCEFSLERGPKLTRFLRSSDRAKNKEHYPSLFFPEVYLLHEGYRAFYQRHPVLCSPTGYTAMLDPKHKELLRKHRSLPSATGKTNHRRHRLLM